MTNIIQIWCIKGDVMKLPTIFGFAVLIYCLWFLFTPDLCGQTVIVNEYTWSYDNSRYTLTVADFSHTHPTQRVFFYQTQYKARFYTPYYYYDKKTYVSRETVNYSKKKYIRQMKNYER